MRVVEVKSQSAPRSLTGRWNSYEGGKPPPAKSYEYQTRRLKPFVGKLQLYGLTNLEIMECLEPLKHENLSNRTIKDFYTTFRTALNWGATFGLVERDIMKGVKHPKVSRVKRQIYQSDELNVFIETAKGYKHYLVLRILALTGMRVGEVLALKWGNLDFKTNKVGILESADIHDRVLKNTKTVCSERDIILDDESIEELRKLKEEMGEINTGKNNLIFQSVDGRPLKYSAIRNTKERVLKRAGLHHIRIHDLRYPNLNKIQTINRKAKVLSLSW